MAPPGPSLQTPRLLARSARVTLDARPSHVFASGAAAIRAKSSGGPRRRQSELRPARLRRLLRRDAASADSIVLSGQAWHLRTGMASRDPNRKRTARGRGRGARRGAAAKSAGETELRRHSAVRDAQRARLLLAAAEAARELGVAEVTVAEIVARSAVSRRTFYEMFPNCHDCLLATFEEGVRRAQAAVVPAYRAGRSWRERISSGLAALLCFLDEQPTLGGFLLVDSLGAGEEVLQRRAGAMRALVDAVDRGRRAARSQKGLSKMSAEGLVGAVLSILHTRMLTGMDASLLSLHGQLMSMIVRPYLGGAAAAAELRRPAPKAQSGRRRRPDLLHEVRIRWTHRTIAVLLAVAAKPGASNREIGARAGISDQGQISKLLTRLQRLELIENSGGPHTKGQPNSWHLSATGAEVEALIKEQSVT